MSETIQSLETYYAGAYWGARKESPEGCARRAEILLAALAGIDPSFNHWFQQGKSRKAALKKHLPPDHEALGKVILQGRDRVFEDLGYSVWAWNGESNDQDASGLNFCCGNHSGSTPNRCVINLPARGPNAERVLTAQVLAGLLRSLAVAWEPDWGVAMSHAHREVAMPSRAPGEPHIAWITYLSRDRGPLPPLPAPVRTESVEGRGTLVILTPERFTASNPEHVALAARVQELLRSAGLLRPEPSPP